jgi:hypothetical protein
MLRVDMHESPNTLSLRLVGRFACDDAENSRALVMRCRDGMNMLVDLTDVTFVDSIGEEVLSFFGRLGAEFVAQTSYAADICERLHLRFAHGEPADSNTTGVDRKNGRARRSLARPTEIE